MFFQSGPQAEKICSDRSQLFDPKAWFIDPISGDQRSPESQFQRCYNKRIRCSYVVSPWLDFGWR